MIITRRFSIKESETLSPGTKYQKLGSNDVLTAVYVLFLRIYYDNRMLEVW